MHQPGNRLGDPGDRTPVGEQCGKPALFHQNQNGKPVLELRGKQQVEGAAKRTVRESQGAPIAKEFFAGCRKQCERGDLLPKSPLAKALRYTLDREKGLSVFLSDPRVPIDTNHLERGLCRIPTGRRNWLLAWTELGRSV